MTIATVKFWSDHIDAPKPVLRNLSNASIEKRMRAALEADDSDNADLFAVRECIGRESWTIERFCLVKLDGLISRDEWPDSD